MPNTALVFGPAGEPITVPIELLAFFLFGSLGTLAFANVEREAAPLSRST